MGSNKYYASLLISKDGEKMYVYGEHNKLFVYSKNGELLSELILEKDYREGFQLTSDNDILIKEIHSFINVNSGNEITFDRCSDFKDGHAFIENGDGNYIIDKDFNLKELDYNIENINNKDDESDAFAFEFDGDYMPIYTIKDILTYKHLYGYSNSLGDVIVPCKYKTREEAKRQLDKYIKDKEKKDAKLAKKQEKIDKKNASKLLKEQKKLKKKKKNNIFDSIPTAEEKNEYGEYSEIYALEDKIKDYLGKIKIPELDAKLKIMQNEFEKKIAEASKNDKENRKNMMLNNITLGLSSNIDSSEALYEKYRMDLIDFIKQLEDNMYIVDILNRLNNFDKGELNDELSNDIKQLYDLYSNLNEELKNKNSNSLNELIQNEKEYFKSYLFRKNYGEPCKYASKEEWEHDFRMKLQTLIYQFKEDFEFQQIADKIANREKASTTLDDNRFEVVLLYINHIKEVISEIESKTDDKDILSKLDEYKNIEIDYSKTPEENINLISNKLKDILKYREDVAYIFDTEKYESYDSHRK